MKKFFDKIPEAIFAEAEKFGVFRDAVEISILCDRNSDGVFCQNYLLFTNDEIFIVSGIDRLLPGTKKNIFSRKTAPVNAFEKFSSEAFSRNIFCDFKAERTNSGCVLTAKNTENNSYKLLTRASSEKLENLSELCDILNEKTDSEKRENKERFSKEKSFEKNNSEEGICPKCGRKYVVKSKKICLHCNSKISVLRFLFGFMKKYKIRMILTLLTLIFTSALSIISPYISSEFFYDKVLSEGGSFYGKILLVIGIMFFVNIISLLVEMLSNVVQAKYVPAFIYDLKKTIFLAMEKMSLSFFTDRKTGSLMNQINGDANTIYWFFMDGFPMFVINSVQVIAVFAVMLIMNVKLTLTALILCPLLAFFMLRITKTVQKLNLRQYSAAQSMNGALSDVLNGTRVVKAFAKEDDEIKKFNIRNEEEANSVKNKNLFVNTTYPFVSVIYAFASILITALGGYFVIKGEISYGRLLAFSAYAAMLYSPISFFVNILQNITGCYTASFRLMEVYDAVPDVVEIENPIKPEKLEGDIKFDNVSFGYDKLRKVIENVSFDVSAGEKFGIVGHTGAGKSTIVNLMIRLYDTTGGNIYIDGENIRNLSFETLRNNIAVVSQETYLFYGTILDNIKYANPNATTEEVIAAAKISGAHDFIVKLENGYNTKIGYGYTDLSGGERQRLSIARAILRDPKILILDEATAAMDTKTERKIQSALNILCEGRTTVIIAHRLSTLKDCDKLMAIEKGKVAEIGTPLELIEKKGIYYKLYTLQYEALKNAGIEE